jgi:nucleotide-binding universal stress UspA family protein
MSSTDHAARIDKVVVGVDGSPSSLAALRWACDQAVAHEAKLYAVMAWSSGPVTVSAGMPRMPDVAPEETARRVLDDAVSEVTGGGPGSRSDGGSDVAIERVVVAGSPAKVLLDMSADADLLVVGSRGIGGFAGLLLGSVSQQVTQHARCPVVVIRPPETPDSSGSTR